MNGANDMDDEEKQEQAPTPEEQPNPSGARVGFMRIGITEFSGIERPLPEKDEEAK